MGEGVCARMNLLWCDMWEYREDKLLSVKSSQLAEILLNTQKFKSSYPKWRKGATEEMITILLEGLNLDDLTVMCKTIEAAFELT